MATTTPEVIKQNITELEQLILTAHPKLPILLREIHKILLADIDNITLLTDADIGILVSGLKKQTATEITAKLMTKKVSLKNTSIDDL